MFKKITIVGLGLMGGSLAAACRKKFPQARIVGVTRNRQALILALKRKWIQEGTSDLAQGVHDADLIVLCTPVDIFFQYLCEIDRVCKKGTLVTDVGSVKEKIQKMVNQKKWKNLSFVSCHPMVGSHECGIQSVNPQLYDQGLMILLRDQRTDIRSFGIVKKFWSRFSRKIVELTPQDHDRFIGEISHLPHAIAVCLVRAVSASSLKYASSGFRDTTRIAASSSSIWQPIFKANEKVMLGTLSRFEHELKSFKKALLAKDTEKLTRFLDQAQKKRQRL